jgi:hypothetical protein
LWFQAYALAYGKFIAEAVPLIEVELVTLTVKQAS